MAENKWREELDIFRKIKPCIVLEGNVFDRFHYEKDPAQRMRELSSYILRFLPDTISSRTMTMPPVSTEMAMEMTLQNSRHFAITSPA